MGHKYRDWVDELVSLRIENQKLEDQIRRCHVSWAGYLREVRQAPAPSSPPPTTALARVEPAAVERHAGFFEGHDAHAPRRRAESIFGEDNPPARSNPQDYLSELVTLRLNNEALKERLRTEECFYQGVMSAARDEERYMAAVATAPSPSAQHPLQLPPASPRRLSPKR